jgi:F420-non-reducing hydrogenase small subunit
MSKPKIAVAWNSSCGGCDESIVDIAEKILEVAEKVEFVLWPCAMDFKYREIENMADGSIAVSLINGGIQNSDQERIVKMLRKKSSLVVAYGSCACMGGVPALANLKNKEIIFERVYLDSATVVNPDKIVPLTECTVDNFKLTLPEIYHTLYKLDDIIEVDYYLPGCAPSRKSVIGALDAILENKLPAKGSVLLPDKALCASCDRNASKPDKVNIKAIKRIHEIIQDEELCMGPATRDGCDYPCVRGNMPCTGCLGPVSNRDQGAAMIGALGGILEGDEESNIDQVMKGIVDPAGTFYRYSLASSILGRERKGDKNHG